MGHLGAGLKQTPIWITNERIGTFPKTNRKILFTKKFNSGKIYPTKEFSQRWRKITLINILSDWLINNVIVEKGALGHPCRDSLQCEAELLGLLGQGSGEVLFSVRREAAHCMEVH